MSALREAYGPAAAWMNLGAIADSYDDPQVSEGEFRRYWLNQPVPLVEAPKGVMPNWAVLASAEALPKVQSVGVALDLDRAWCSVGGAGVADAGRVARLAQQRQHLPVRRRNSPMASLI